MALLALGLLVRILRLLTILLRNTNITSTTNRANIRSMANIWVPRHRPRLRAVASFIPPLRVILVHNNLFLAFILKPALSLILLLVPVPNPILMFSCMARLNLILQCRFKVLTKVLLRALWV
jgi:hypothetical protein